MEYDIWGFILKSDAAYISETMVLTCHTTAQWNNLEYHDLNLYLRDNLKSNGSGQPVLQIVFSRVNDDVDNNSPNSIRRFWHLYV
jgi:hypothetical protein